MTAWSGESLPPSRHSLFGTITGQEVTLQIPGGKLEHYIVIAFDAASMHHLVVRPRPACRSHLCVRGSAVRISSHVGARGLGVMRAVMVARAVCVRHRRPAVAAALQVPRRLADARARAKGGGGLRSLPRRVVYAARSQRVLAC